MITVYRYSGTQDKKIARRGVKGEMKLSELPEELLAADPELKTCPAVAERIAELFAQAADTLN